MRPIVNVPEEDRATATGNVHKKLVTITRGVPEISSRTDRQTYSSQYFATALAGEVKIPSSYYPTRNCDHCDCTENVSVCTRVRRHRAVHARNLLHSCTTRCDTRVHIVEAKQDGRREDAMTMARAQCINIAPISDAITSPPASMATPDAAAAAALASVIHDRRICHGSRQHYRCYHVIPETVVRTRFACL